MVPCRIHSQVKANSLRALTLKLLTKLVSLLTRLIGLMAQRMLRTVLMQGHMMQQMLHSVHRVFQIRLALLQKLPIITEILVSFEEVVNRINPLIIHVKDLTVKRLLTQLVRHLLD